MAKARWWHQENIMIKSYQQTMLSPFFQFMADLQQSRMRIVDAWSMILTFEVTVPFYLTKSEDRAKRYKSLAHSYQTLHGARGNSSSASSWCLQKYNKTLDQAEAIRDIPNRRHLSYRSPNHCSWHLDWLKYTVDLSNRMCKKKQPLRYSPIFKSIDICKSSLIFFIEINSLKEVKEI